MSLRTSWTKVVQKGQNFHLSRAYTQFCIQRNYSTMEYGFYEEQLITQLIDKFSPSVTKE
jgi:hypothetical protein